MLHFFKKTIKVIFIDDATGDTIGISEMRQEQLPEAFDKPTTMQIADKEWQVIKADPIYARDFSTSKKLTLHLRNIENINPQDIRFSIPTISNELPAIVNTTLFHDFTLDLHEDDWRQIEFFPIKLLPVIQKEMAAVEALLFPEGESTTFSGFDTVHVRKINRQDLSIDFSDFCKLVNIRQKGALTVTFAGHSGFVQDGFALRSDNYTYYGTVKNEIINELCLQQFDQADDEFFSTAARYGLVLTVWCRGQITTV
jgi:hypothetical protein